MLVRRRLPLAAAMRRVQSAVCWEPRASGGTVTLESYLARVDSENPSGADNQQERPGLEQWVVGITDGEGCFSVCVVRHPACGLGWQVQHEYSVTQSAGSLDALRLIRSFFGCWRVIVNPRRDNHREALARYSVKSRRDLLEAVIPFFDEHPLITAKQQDYEVFREALSPIALRRHLEPDGMAQVAALTERMNRRRRSRYLESSEAIRRPSRPDAEKKIWS